MIFLCSHHTPCDGMGGWMVKSISRHCLLMLVSKQAGRLYHNVAITLRVMEWGGLLWQGFDGGLWWNSVQGRRGACTTM